MNIAVAQTKSIAGDLLTNRKKHLDFIQLAAENKTDLIIFSELSLSGYEPTLTDKLALELNDSQLDVFQQHADLHHMCIIIGAPLQATNGTQIGLVIFQPNIPRTVHEKKYLYVDEEEHFVPGTKQVILSAQNEKIALSICYELSVEAHREAAIQADATVYLCSVAKTKSDMPKTDQLLSAMAKSNKIQILLANCVGIADRYDCCGNSSVWNSQGTLVERMNSQEEGLLCYNTKTGLSQLKILN